MEPPVEHARTSSTSSPAARSGRLPTHSPLAVARFGLLGLPDIRRLARACFRDEASRALLAGAAAHGMLPLTRAVTGGLGLPVDRRHDG